MYQNNLDPETPDTLTIDQTTDYAEKVCRGDIIAGPWVRKACERHILDMMHAEKRGYYFDEDLAEKTFDFFESHVYLEDADLGGEPMVLFDWEKFVLGSLYGWVRDDGRRRFKVAYVETGKGSGKSPLAAGIGVRSICADGESRAECYVCARHSEQALVTFKDATAIIQFSPELRSRLRIYGGENPWNIVHKPSHSFMKRISSKKTGDGKSGPRPHVTIVDEYHEHESDAMLNYYIAGQKNRRQPLAFIITNAGVGTSSACGVEHDLAIKISRGEIQNDQYFAYVCAMDKDDKPYQDENCWIKTNPSLPTIPGYEYLREQVASTYGKPSLRAVVDRLNFCKWTEALSPWLDPEAIEACEVEELSPFEIRRQVPLYMALDLSSKKDFTAMTLCWDLDEWLETDTIIWTPEETLEARAIADVAPYIDWLEQGYITTTPGATVDFGFVASAISEIDQMYNLIGIAYDPWRMDVLMKDLEKLGITTSPRANMPGITIVAHAQGFVGGAKVEHAVEKIGSKAIIKARRDETLWMPQSIDDTEEKLLNKRIKIKYNAAFRSALFGAAVIEDASKNRRFNKIKSSARIDPAVTWAMAVGYACKDFGQNDLVKLYNQDPDSTRVFGIDA